MGVVLSKKSSVGKEDLGSGAADKAAIQQVSERDSERKSCRVNCPESDM